MFVKWIAIAIVVSALLVAGAIIGAAAIGNNERPCDDNPYTTIGSC